MKIPSTMLAYYLFITGMILSILFVLESTQMSLSGMCRVAWGSSNKTSTVVVHI